MLRLLQLEEIDTLLLEVPRLVSRFERRESAFDDSVLDWLTRAETALGNSRLPAAAEVAALRSRLVGAMRGVTPPDLVLRGRVTRRKLRDGAAAAAVDRASAAIDAAVREPRGRIAEAERLFRQVLAVAQQKGYDLSREGPLSLIQTLRKDADLAGPTTHAVGLVGVQDALILLDRSLAALAAPSQPAPAHPAHQPRR